MKPALTEQIHSAITGKRHIIWDWNGTLLDDVGHAVSVINSLLDEHDLPRIDQERYRKIFDFPVLRYFETLGFDFEKEPFESLCHK